MNINVYVKLKGEDFSLAVCMLGGMIPPMHPALSIKNACSLNNHVGVRRFSLFSEISVSPSNHGPLAEMLGAYSV